MVVIVIAGARGYFKLSFFGDVITLKFPGPTHE